MKRIVSLLFICFLLASLWLPCLATDFANPPLIDEAGYLSESEFLEIAEALEEVRQKYNFEVAIVTEYEMSGYDAESTADDIYDYCGYGAGANDDGILLYICAGTRDYHFTTHADGMRVFNENGIAYLMKKVQPYLAEDDYYQAMKTYAEVADELLAMAANGDPFNKKQYDNSYLLMVLGGAILIPLLIAFFMMNGKLSKMKTAVANNYAANYIKQGSKTLTVSRDFFLYSHVTKTERPKNNSGSHTSSSGRTHGGGGGKF